MSDGDYLLGTRDDEVERLGVQHRVWRDQMLRGFATAGFGPGQTILDVGSGPGFATQDLSAIVGPAGKVIAFERSPHFLNVLRARKLSNVEVCAADILDQSLGDGIADGAWTRWVLAFVADPAKAVARIARALKPNGIAVFHEYLDYEAWRLLPVNNVHERYRHLVIKSWRDSGGEPNAAQSLPLQLTAAGLELVAIRPMVEIISAGDAMWQWPTSFMVTSAWRLHELGYCSAEEAEEFAALPNTFAPDAHMLTPVVAEIIARKR